MLCHEKSFRLEVLVIILLQISLSFVDLSFACTAILRLSLFLPLIAEAINSAIERTVDLVTEEYDPLAKQAKDLGSAAVFFTIILTTLIWAFTIYYVLAGS
jgi:diacylglycerol kinase (ATP)